jgi:hypothetical protein
VRAVVGALQMAPQEVVVAFVLVERLVRRCKGVLQTRTTRRTWMACCCLAVLNCTDGNINSARLHARLEREVFWGMEHEDLMRLVIGTFELMDWRLPSGSHTGEADAVDYQAYAAALCAATNGRGVNMAPLPDIYAATKV